MVLDMQPVLQMDMTSPEQINFVFNKKSKYQKGIEKNDATILKVTSTVKWDLYAVGRSTNKDPNAEAAKAAAAGAGRRRAKPETFKRDVPKVGRNEKCPCGSGKKYKQCHLRIDAAKEREQREQVVLPSGILSLTIE